MSTASDAFDGVGASNTAAHDAVRAQLTVMMVLDAIRRFRGFMGYCLRTLVHTLRARKQNSRACVAPLSLVSGASAHVHSSSSSYEKRCGVDLSMKDLTARIRHVKQCGQRFRVRRVIWQLCSSNKRNKNASSRRQRYHR